MGRPIIVHRASEENIRYCTERTNNAYIWLLNAKRYFYNPSDLLIMTTDVYWVSREGFPTNYHFWIMIFRIIPSQHFFVITDCRSTRRCLWKKLFVYLTEDTVSMCIHVNKCPWRSILLRGLLCVVDVLMFSHMHIKLTRASVWLHACPLCKRIIFVLLNFTEYKARNPLKVEIYKQKWMIKEVCDINRRIRKEVVGSEICDD